MDKIHNHVIGIDNPLRRNPFYKCPYFLLNKMSKRSLKRKAHKNKTKSSTHEPISETSFNQLQDDDKIEGKSGQYFYMDYAFVWGSEYKVKNETRPTMTSIDGFN